MSLETVETKAALKELVDTFSNLAGEKRIADQMPLFTPDTKVQVDITRFTASVKRSNHMNGQHVVTIDGGSATGVAYCHVKLVSEEDGKEFVTDSSIRYDDEYVRRDGRWQINKRISHFSINDKRRLGS